MMRKARFIHLVELDAAQAALEPHGPYIASAEEGAIWEAGTSEGVWPPRLPRRPSQQALLDPPEPLTVTAQNEAPMAEQDETPVDAQPTRVGSQSNRRGGRPPPA